MRRILPLLLLFLLLFCLALPAQAERKVALIIGNSGYQHVARLANPGNDAKLMGEALKGIGFELVGGQAQLDISDGEAMKRLIQRFGEMIRGGGVGLFYYSGHGLQVDGKNYLVPTGANVATKTQIKYQLVDADFIMDEMAASSTKVNVVILDACRNNPFGDRGLREVKAGLASVIAPTGTLVAYSTAPGKTATDGSGRNSPYTAALAKYIKSPGMRIEDVFIRVNRDVAKSTGGEQSPWKSDNLTDVFCLHGACGAPVASLPTSSPVYTSAPLPKISAPPKPGSGSLDLSDIDADAAARAKAEAEQARLDAAARKEWAARLKAMLSDFAKVQTVEKSGQYTPEHKAKAWEKLLAAYSDKNPYTDQDQTLRSKAQTQQSHWEAEARRLADAQAASLAAAQAKKQQMLAMAKVPSQPPNAGAPLKAPVGTSGQTWRDPATGMEFVWVPGGTFEMGCGSWTSECYSDEKPVHSVRLSGFWLGKFEVTQGQWQRVMGNNPSYFKKGDSYPVEQVSWDDAKEFISKLNAQGSAKFRLPTEAEWEYAARSGGKPEKYAGGNDVASVAWYGSNSGSSTHAVGTKAPNGLGLYDMSGNVWEWCEDVFASYSSSSQDDPVVTGGGSSRVYRGGGWYNEPRSVRAANRNYYTPVYRVLNLGFRLARTN